MKVFISGSKMLNRTDKGSELPETVKRKIDDLITSETDILIGDCMGPDSHVQEYLHGKGYRNVTVYFAGIGRGSRKNAGRWEDKCIRADAETAYGFHIEKDFAMAQDADSGLAIWDGKSKGTFVNMVNLVVLGKKCRVYLLDEDRWVEITSMDELAPFAGMPGKWDAACVRETLKKCGFADEMADFLTYNGEISAYKIVDIVCTAPVALTEKVTILGSLMKKRNIKDEVFQMVCAYIKEGATYKAIRKGIRAIANSRKKDTIWTYVYDSAQNISAARDEMEPDGDFDDDYKVTYLLEEWYDSDVLMEKVSPCGMFCSHEMAESYMSREEKDGDGVGCYRLEIWDQTDFSQEKARYDYLYYDGRACWFEKMAPVMQENGNVYYLPEDHRFSSGDLDLNLETPYRTGDIVHIDCRPFGPPFHAMILECRNQSDCCFPNILFRMPYTDEWRITPLKHRRFYKDTESGSYYPMLSPLYRLRLVHNDELSGDDELLLKISAMIAGDEEKAGKVWKEWINTDPEDKSKEQMMRIVGDERLAM